MFFDKALFPFCTSDDTKRMSPCIAREGSHAHQEKMSCTARKRMESCIAGKNSFITRKEVHRSQEEFIHYGKMSHHGREVMHCEERDP